MKILVTGATGCLGGVTARKLAAMGHAVTGTGRNLANGEALVASSVTFKPADLNDRPTMRELVSRHDAVLHCGGLSSAWGSEAAFRRANVDGTRIIVEAACETGARLVFVSSPSIYFDFTDRIGIKEDRLPARRPVNAYAASKIAAEGLIAEAASSGLDAAILRPRAIFGETDQALLPRFLRAAGKGYLPLIDGGRAIIDLTYVDNVADALAATVLRPARFSGEAYNISNGEPLAVRDLFQRLTDGIGLRAKFVDIPFRLAYLASAAMECAAMLRPSQPEPVLTRYAVGMIGKSQTLSIAAARHDLGYSPAISVSEGMDRTIAAWRAAHA